METGKKGRATYQDVLDAPEHLVAEIVDGELHLSPRPNTPGGIVHTRFSAWAETRFGGSGPGPGGWVIISECELHLGEDIVAPDMSGWRAVRNPDVSGAYVTMAPDWICEVLSPSTQRYDRHVKLPKLAGHGVQWAWLLHPRKRTLETLRARDGVWEPVAMHQGDVVVRAEPFADAELDLGRLWSGLPPAGVANEEPVEYAP